MNFKDELGKKILKIEFSKYESLEQVIKENSGDTTFIAQESLRQGLINKKSLFKFADIYLKAQDKSLNKKHDRNQIEKWNFLLQFENLGEILLRKKKIKINQLIEVLEEKEANDSLILEELLVSKSLVNHEDIYEALEFQINSEFIASNSFRNLVSLLKGGG